MKRLFYSILAGALFTMAQSTLSAQELTTSPLLAGCNIGAEIPVGERWSAGLEWSSPWMFRTMMDRVSGEPLKNCFQFQGLDLNSTLWMGRHQERLPGHGISIHAGALRYDFERNYSGYQGEAVYLALAYRYRRKALKGRIRSGWSLGAAFYFNSRIHYVADYALGTDKVNTLFADRRRRDVTGLLPYISWIVSVPLRKEVRK